MPFDFSSVQTVEFGVSFDTDQGEAFHLIPVAPDVQGVLKEMVKETLDSIYAEGSVLEEFSPAQKYAQNERLRIGLESDIVAKHRDVYQAENISFAANALSEPSKLVAYFVILRDRRRAKLMAFRRAGQFKGILRRKLLHFSDDALRLFEDNVFKLDQDFDFMIVDGQVLIWRPSGFEFSADMEKYLAASAEMNLSTIAEQVTCVRFDTLRGFVDTHKRAMRLVAAIKSRDDLGQISLKKLRECCKNTGVTLEGDKRHVWPASGHEMDFLLILDRRRYPIELVENRTEIYEAMSRKLTK